MRIRKHAKISPLIYATSSLKPGAVLQTHVCQLNQSPWDVMTFSPPPPPPPSQVNGSAIIAGNGSSGYCISDAEREFNSWRQSDYPHTLHNMDDEDPPPVAAAADEKDILCCKTDGKSWQCRRVASKGNSLCEHHLSMVKSYGNNHATKKSTKPVGEPLLQRRPRPKKAPSSSSSSANPYEFYYYSGFGPRWGKKRGENCKNDDCAMGRDVVDEHESETAANGVSRITPKDFDFVEYDDDDDDDDEKRRDGKKRVRKPIKARSLKSLM